MLLARGVSKIMRTSNTRPALPFPELAEPGTVASSPRRSAPPVPDQRRAPSPSGSAGRTIGPADPAAADAPPPALPSASARTWADVVRGRPVAEGCAATIPGRERPRGLESLKWPSVSVGRARALPEPGPDVRSEAIAAPSRTPSPDTVARAGRAAQVFRAIVEGRIHEASLSEVAEAQAIALATARDLFMDPQLDAGLRAAVEAKLRCFVDRHPGAEVAELVLGDRDARTRQLDALSLLLWTFTSPDDPGDRDLRLAIMDKLAGMGRLSDLPPVLLHVRRATTPSDLWKGQECVRGITARLGPPVDRARLADEPEIGPLLVGPKRAQADWGVRLSPEDRERAITAVLERGKIKGWTPFRGEHYGAAVWVVEFEDRLPGEDGPIKAAFKPEPSWPDKRECWYSREILAYVFDRAVTRTSRVPVTVEALLPVYAGAGERWCSCGSMSFWEPKAEPYGRKPASGAWNASIDEVPGKFRHLERRPWFQDEMAQARTLLYLLNNPDCIANNMVSRNNYANILVVQDDRWTTKLIDWASAVRGDRNAGGVDDAIRDDFLPRRPVPEIAAALRRVPSREVIAVAEGFVKRPDARFLAGRVRHLRQAWQGT